MRRPTRTAPAEEPPDSPTGRAATWRGIPGGIWALGFVSLLMDVSSEMIHAVLPLYLVGALGVSMASVGLIEGVAEATASITKVFSGALSDRLGRRKGLAVAGYGLSALVKPVFPLAASFGWLVAARFVDRLGKGIRGAPRDALVADLAPPALRGASYGLRQSLDTIGAFAGPLLAVVLLWGTANDFTTVFAIAVVPAFLAVALLVVAVREPASASVAPVRRVPLGRTELAALGSGVWQVLGVATLFTLARFSEAFLILRAQSLGLALAAIPATLVVMNVAYSLSAWPVGTLSDRVGRPVLLGIGLALLVAADLVLAFAGGAATLALGVALWGLHMGFTQSLLATLVADRTPPALRGTAFGLYGLVTGVALLIASAVAGLLWDAFGARATFLAGAAFALLALLGLLALDRASRDET